MSFFIAVDFDGTMVDHRYPEIGEPVPHAIDSLKKYMDMGADIILYTMRSDTEAANRLTDAANYMTDNGIKLFGVNHNPAQDSWTTSPKCYAHVYIDDSAAGTPLVHPDGFARPCVDWIRVTEVVVSKMDVKKVRTLPKSSSE